MTRTRGFCDNPAAMETNVAGLPLGCKRKRGNDDAFHRNAAIAVPPAAKRNP